VVKIQKFRTIEVPCKEHGNKWKKGTVWKKNPENAKYENEAASKWNFSLFSTSFLKENGHP
jgi:hypothetical protein